MEVEIKIFDSFSLEDKSKVMNRIKDYAKGEADVSVKEFAEIAYSNRSSIAFVSLSEDLEIAKSALEEIIIKMEKDSQIEFISKSMQRLL